MPDITKKDNIEASEAFQEYEEEIVSNPAYSGMPDLRCEDGSIQWEAPSNRGSGIFQFTHDKRYQWWVQKAEEVGISTDEDHWISKVAKMIHPTKLHPCKVCGRVMDIRYCYLSKRFINRVQKLPFYKEPLNIDELTHILDFIPMFVDTYGSLAFASLPALLRCAQFPVVPNLGDDLAAWTSWVEQTYIPLEPCMLGPGAMANPPDRLDGFHTYNRCCRRTADKGRSKENLASYSTDRRAFENWSDGNWLTANKLMGYINSNSAIKQERCANDGDGAKHARPCSADHIGPISLGFCHRPEFQLLCNSCNSAKNNRMYYSDVTHLMQVEKTGIPVTTWYATPIWNRCKEKVVDRESSLRLCRIMRDNRNIALHLLSEFAEHKEYLFMLTLLNLDFADFEYEIIPDSVCISKQIVTAEFSKKPSSLRYVAIQKSRKIRVAFTSLEGYSSKENRNGLLFSNKEIEILKKKCFNLLSCCNSKLKVKNNELARLMGAKNNVDKNLGAFLSNLDYSYIKNNPQFKIIKSYLIDIMEIVADELSSHWDDPRYSREIDFE